MAQRIATLVALTLVALCPAVQAQPPVLSYSTPLAVAPGKTADVTFFGSGMAGVTGLWASAPLHAELTPGIDQNGALADRATYRLTVPASNAVGPAAVRIANGAGVSNVRLMLVDDLPTLPENGANKLREQAQELPLGSAVEGVADAESSDFFKFRAAAGQRVSVEVYAKRLGQPLDAIVRVLDSSGRELFFSDDTPGIGPDLRFAFSAPSEGEYTLEIRDVAFGGGGRYRLRLGDFPVGPGVFPLAAQAGSTPLVSILGEGNEALPPQAVAVAAGTAGQRVGVGVRGPAGLGASAFEIVSTSVPEQVETEPNDALEQATPINLQQAGALRGGFSGRLLLPGDRDFYTFEAKAGQRAIFTGQTRSLGLPTDLYMRLTHSSGAVVSEADDSGTEEGVIDFNCTTDGVYTLMVEHVSRFGGPEHAYRVQVDAYEPGFALVSDVEKVDAPQQGVFVAKIVVARRDYNGPITLSVEGAGPGLVLANNVIPEGVNEIVLSATLPADLPAGQQAAIRIVGTAMIGEKEFRATASNLTVLRAALAGYPYPPAVIDGLLGLGVGPVFPDFFQLAVAPDVVALPQLFGANSFKVVATRLNGFVDPITLAVEGAPEGITLTAANVEANATEAVFQVAGPVDLPEGDHAFTIRGSGVFQNQPRSVVLANVVLRVVKPLAVELVPAGPLVVGGTQTLKVRVTRYGDQAPAVTVALAGLPAGVTGPAEIIVPEGQTELDITLTAAADAAVGQASLSATAAARLKETDVSVASPAVALDVTSQ